MKVLIKSFLESSTIHGLTYISTTKHAVKLFWIATVIAGFTAASFLILRSFKDWNESPIKTTIETLPIADITFPKLTVCPPKNTFTDLNYDIIMTENMTLKENQRNELTKLSQDLLHDHLLDKTKNDLATLQEKNTYFNWYQGYTEINIPISNYGYDIYYRIDTSAASGEIATQHFGKKFDPNMFPKKIKYQVFIYPPINIIRNNSVSLHFDIQKISGSADTFELHGEKIGADRILISKIFRPPNPSGENRYLRLARKILDENYQNMDFEQMPGFKLLWNYTGKLVSTEAKYYDNNDHITRHFIRNVS